MNNNRRHTPQHRQHNLRARTLLDAESAEPVHLDADDFVLAETLAATDEILQACWQARSTTTDDV